MLFVQIPFKFACGSALSLRNSLTFWPPPQTHMATPTSPPHILDSCQRGPGPKKRDPSVVFLQRSGCCCLCARWWGGWGEAGTPLFTGLIPAVVLSRGLWHTSEGYGCFKSRRHDFHVWCVCCLLFEHKNPPPTVHGSLTCVSWFDVIHAERMHIQQLLQLLSEYPKSSCQKRLSWKKNFTKEFACNNLFLV